MSIPQSSASSDTLARLLGQVSSWDAKPSGPSFEEFVAGLPGPLRGAISTRSSSSSLSVYSVDSTLPSGMSTPEEHYEGDFKSLLDELERVAEHLPRTPSQSSMASSENTIRNSTTFYRGSMDTCNTVVVPATGRRVLSSDVEFRFKSSDKTSYFLYPLNVLTGEEQVIQRPRHKESSKLSKLLASTKLFNNSKRRGIDKASIRVIPNKSLYDW